ncbi:hypothetical protein H5410_037607 [Solanum commersonii]|uniref:Uncharacterized protein n=1 Tax=Solanum commersonii TaxID=4109 RepID=A0A9J5Y8X5_SOLCO|nr:hypothetical protein H5410_037607 [Solanum commersonii]
MNMKKLEIGNIITPSSGRVRSSSSYGYEARGMIFPTPQILLNSKVRVRAWEIREKEEKKKRRKGRSSKEIIVISSGVIPIKVCELLLMG